MTATAQNTNTDLLAARVRTHCNLIVTKMGDLATLSTTDKTSVVNSINELHTLITGGPVINDAGTSNSDIWSAAQIIADRVAAIDGLVNAAPGTLDTIGEIATALGNNPDAITALQTQAANNTTAVVAAQSTADGAQTAADAAQTSADSAVTTANTAATNAVTAQTAADAAQATATAAEGASTTNASDIAAMQAALGATDYVVTFETGLTAP